MAFVYEAEETLKRMEGRDNVEGGSKAEGMNGRVFKKTGTTIVGLVTKEAVILAADTRATAGEVVCDKNCQKIHFIAPNMYCCGAGTAADTEMTTEFIASKLSLQRLSTGRQSRVETAVKMLRHYLFQYHGYVGAYLILGGVDVYGPQLHAIHAAGSSDQLSFCADGSGCLAALGALETHYREGMSIEEGIEVARLAIRAGILNDMGSGSNIDVCVITKDGAKMHRNIDTPEGAKRTYRNPAGFKFTRGVTLVTNEKVIPIENTGIPIPVDTEMTE